MSETLLIDADLDDNFQPKVKWLHSQRFVGLLFLNVPGKEEFQLLIDRLGSPVLSITICHAEFGKPLSRNVFGSTDEAYFSVFSSIHENIFIEVVYDDSRYFVWMPEDHNFYALFGSYNKMRSVFSVADVTSTRNDFAEYIANDIFNDRAKRHLSNAQSKYMTFENFDTFNTFQ